MIDGTYTGAIDRIEDEEIAVILLEDDGEVVEQLDVPVAALPEAASPGSVLVVEVEDGELVDAAVDEDETEARREDVSDRLDRLSDRLSDR